MADLNGNMIATIVLLGLAVLFIIGGTMTMMRNVR